MTYTATKSSPASRVKPDLQGLREALENVDRQVLTLLSQRMTMVEKVAEAKIQTAYPFRDHGREELVLQRVRHLAVELDLDPHRVESLYQLIMEMSISHQQAHLQGMDDVALRVAYQGVEGAYSHLAAQRRYAGRSGGALLTGFPSISEAAHAVRTGDADFALLPIENSTAGSINETYDELASERLTITAEVISLVEHCLIGLPGSRIDDLRTVMSHPQALSQCADFLARHAHITPLAEYDTAGSARKVKEAGDPRVAAIASTSAAELLGLEILAEGIQLQQGNATRFVEVAIEASPCPEDHPCKTSLVMNLDHSAGALGEILVHFGRRQLQLAKIESRPIPEDPWKYRFYLDVEGHAESSKMKEAFEVIRPLVSSLRVLGSYPKALQQP